MNNRRLTVLLIVGIAILNRFPVVYADWHTHRGNAARTGAADDQAGPRIGKVLWVHAAREHYIAAPVPGPDAVYVSGLGAFNTARFDALSIDPAAKERVLWSKQAPSLKLPTVCSPAVVDGKLIFGDGMHQTDGAVLHCMSTQGGLPIWQLPVPGRLVHLEGSPTVSGGRVFIGGGNAGVLCVELNRVVLDGKEQSVAEVQAAMSARWKQLVAKYEDEKKRDPDFAVPPNEDALAKPSPKLAWQVSRDQWHVDAPLAVIGKQVLVAAAYLEDEKVGERMLASLDSDNGQTGWKTPLKLNPWGGPTVADGLVILGCSSTRLDPDEVTASRGEVLAVDLTSGAVRWRKDVPGGVVSAVTIAQGLAVFTATDGKVRAWEAASGNERWSYDAGAPLFAGAAIANSLIYAANLKGVVHCLELAGGKTLWKLDLASEPVKARGMVYGSPLVAGGRLYVATCDPNGTGGGGSMAVVCIGEK